MKFMNVIAVFTLALTASAKYASRTISALPRAMAWATVRLDIPTNRPTLPEPNICSDNCDTYYKDCVIKKCLPSDSVDKINQCKQLCLEDTCKNGYFLAAVSHGLTFD